MNAPFSRNLGEQVCESLDLGEHHPSVNVFVKEDGRLEQVAGREGRLRPIMKGEGR